MFICLSALNMHNVASFNLKAGVVNVSYCTRQYNIALCVELFRGVIASTFK